MQQDTDSRGLEKCSVHTQNDPGATHCITKYRGLLQNFKSITPLPIAGVASDETPLYATGVGMIILQSEEGDRLIVECLYSNKAEGTLILPTAITM